MKAAVLPEFGSPLTIETLPDPEPGAGELVVDVVAAPVLSYSNEVFSGDREYPLQLPLAPGVGGVGRVRAVGPDATWLAPGDWVLCDPVVRSRDDPVSTQTMLQGWIAPGEGAKRLQSHFRHGAFAEQMLLPLESAVPLGDIDQVDAARWCALLSMLVPYGGLLAANVQAGGTVLVSGATGHFGSAGVAVALAMGAGSVVTPGRNEAVLEDLTHRFGSRIRTVVLTGDEQKDRQNMREAASGPIDTVLDILPPLPDSTPVRAAALTVRPHGTIVLMGGSRVDLELPYAYLQRNCITVRGQHMYPREARLRLIDLAQSGLLSLDEFEMTSFDLGEANETVTHAATEGGAFQLTVLEP